MVHLFPSNLGFNECIPVQGITVENFSRVVKILIKLFNRLKNFQSKLGYFPDIFLQNGF